MTRLRSVITKCFTYPETRTILCVLLGCLVLTSSVTRVASHPAHMYRAPGQNIQHFACTGKGSSGKGVCMFALDCNKAKGTHLGTCVDRFFFGSCCRLPDNVKLETLYKTSTSSAVLSNEINPSTFTTTPLPATTPMSTRRPITFSTSFVSPNDDDNSLVTLNALPTTVRVVLKTTTSTQKGYPTTTQSSKPVTAVALPTKPMSPTPSRISVTDNDVLASTFPTNTHSISTATDSTSTAFSDVTSVSSSTSTTTEEEVFVTTMVGDSTATSGSTVDEDVNRLSTTTTSPPTLPTSTLTAVSSTMILTTSEPPSVTEPSTTTAETFDPAKIGEMDYTQACGRQLIRERPTARIVSGQKAEFGEWPWQISLRQWKRTTFMHKCGAALLNENWAITAAHCVDRVPPEDLLLRIGEYDLSSSNEVFSHVERRVQITTTHPDFNSRTFENDLALLRFYEPVTFQENIIPICLPANDDDFVNKTGYVTGWGRLYVDGPLPNILQEVQVPVITNLACEQEYRRAGFLESIPNIFLCAGYPEGGRDSCEGDSGGPLVIRQPNNRWVLAGIISWGIGCAEPHQPGVYTRISQFRDWINPILVF